MAYGDLGARRRRWASRRNRRIRIDGCQRRVRPPQCEAHQPAEPELGLSYCVLVTPNHSDTVHACGHESERQNSKSLSDFFGEDSYKFDFRVAWRTALQPQLKRVHRDPKSTTEARCTRRVRQPAYSPWDHILRPRKWCSGTPCPGRASPGFSWRGVRRKLSIGMRLSSDSRHAGVHAVSDESRYANSSLRSCGPSIISSVRAQTSASTRSGE